MCATVQDKFAGLFIQNGRFDNDFENEQGPIGVGKFGIVTKAKNKMDGEEYAIKKIIVRDYKDCKNKERELQVWAKIANKYYVHYNTAWVEKYSQIQQDQFLINNFQVEINKQPGGLAGYKRHNYLDDYAIFHIQMELCAFSLRKGIEKIKTFFKIEKGQLLCSVAYYMVSEIFTEILKAIEYLHNFPKPVLHRDIKPENILVLKKPGAKFIKIGDFGMAVFEEYPEISHTQMRGTIRYMAPEVMTSRKYDTKADIYSIGVMIQELFNFDINFNPPENISPKYEKIIELTGKAMNGQRKARPPCTGFLTCKNLWAMSYEDVKNELGQYIDLSRNYDMVSEFPQFFLKEKIEFNQK